MSAHTHTLSRRKHQDYMSQFEISLSLSILVYLAWKRVLVRASNLFTWTGERWASEKNQQSINHLRQGCNGLHFQQRNVYLSSNLLKSLSVLQQDSSPLSFSSHSLIDHRSFWDTEYRCDNHPNAPSPCLYAVVNVSVCDTEREHLTFWWTRPGVVWKHNEWMLTQHP